MINAVNKRISRLIKRAKRELLWPVCEITGHDVDTLEIVSDHGARTHTIYLPCFNVRPIEHLHELGHAFLCEQVHTQFSTHYFKGRMRTLAATSSHGTLEVNHVRAGIPT